MPSLALACRLSAVSRASRRPFSPASLFSSGEQGVWYDPSDLSTLYQDAAGTTPVTAVEQPVGRMLDKSGRGNHATQDTTASRPVLSARVNMLTYTEQFDNAAWATGRTTVLSNVAVAPDGSLTADKLVEDTSSNTPHVLTQMFRPSVGLYTFSIYMKAAERTHAALYTWASGGNSASLTINLTNGNVVASVGPFVDVTVVHLGSGWFNVKAQFAPNSTASREFQLRTVDETGNHSYTGDGTSGIYIWGADLRPTNSGVNLPPYQRVGASTDYDTAGFPAYLKFDGVDDYLSTGSIDFTATDKMTVCAGVRKLSDADVGMVVGLSSTPTNAGAIELQAPAGTAVANYRYRSSGTTLVSATSSGAYASPITNVLTGISNIGAPVVTLRINGTQAATVTSSQGTGNYGNYPLYIGSRAGTSYYFNGHLYSLIVRGAQSSEAQILSAEAYCNQKTGAY